MSLLFRNRWFALLWLAMSVASATFFVSEQGGARRLLDGASQIRAHRQGLQTTTTSSVHVIAEEAADSTPPVLLPAGDLDADPNDPQPGDVFIEAVSGRRVRVLGNGAPATTDPAE